MWKVVLGRMGRWAGLANYSTEGGTGSFISLLKDSPFVRLGDPRGRVVVGRVVAVTKTDYYVDYGGKFEAVVGRTERFEVGRNCLVYLLMTDHERVANYGAEHWVTLREADATLLGVVRR